MPLIVRWIRTIPWLVLALLVAPRLASAELVWAIDTNRHLVVFASESPETPLLEEIVSGMTEEGEYILAIDFRPLTGQLYGYSTTNRLYRIHPWTAQATVISPAPTVPRPPVTRILI